MRIKLARSAALALVVLFTLALCVADAGAQTRRRKRSRRITNPVISNVPSAPQETAQPNAPEPKIISTAEDQANDSGNGEPNASGTTTRRAANRARAGAAEADQQDAMRRTVNKLSTQVNQLTDKLSQMEEQQRTLVNLERLSRAEQRAENLRAQLREVQSKEADLEARAEQLDYALQPQNLDNALAGFGSTRPEEMREQRRRQLENERARVRTQLDQLASGRIRLESAIANADAEADRIRQLVDAVNTPNTNPPSPTVTTTDSNTTNNNETSVPSTSTGTTQTSPSTSGTSPGTSNSGAPTYGPPR